MDSIEYAYTYVVNWNGILYYLGSLYLPIFVAEMKDVFMV